MSAGLVNVERRSNVLIRLLFASNAWLCGLVVLIFLLRITATAVGVADLTTSFLLHNVNFVWNDAVALRTPSLLKGSSFFKHNLLPEVYTEHPYSTLHSTSAVSSGPNKISLSAPPVTGRMYGAVVQPDTVYG